MVVAGNEIKEGGAWKRWPWCGREEVAGVWLSSATRSRREEMVEREQWMWRWCENGGGVDGGEKNSQFDEDESFFFFFPFFPFFPLFLPFYVYQPGV